MKQPPIKPGEKRPLDENTLQQLLSAAHVVQQHNERLQAGQKPDARFSHTLTEVVGVQEQIRGRRLNMHDALTLIARRTREISNASGVAIGLLDGSRERLQYYAATGGAASQAGLIIDAAASLTVECLATGLVLQSPQAENDPRLDSVLCRALDVKSLIAAPIHHDGIILGVLELHFAETQSFREHDVRVCQLMAALTGEVCSSPATGMPASMIPESPASSFVPPSDLAENSVSQKQNPEFLKNDYQFPTDPASMLAALEKLRPQIEDQIRNQSDTASLSIPSEPISHTLTPSTAPTSAPSTPAPSTKLSAELQPFTSGPCRHCGHPLGDEELFCGVCGAACHAQSTWGSLWDLQRKAENQALSNPNGTHPEVREEPLDVFTSELEAIVAKFSAEPFDEFPKSSELHVPPPAIASQPENKSQNSASSVMKDLSTPDFSAQELPAPPSKVAVPEIEREKDLGQPEAREQELAQKHEEALRNISVQEDPFARPSSRKGSLLTWQSPAAADSDAEDFNPSHSFTQDMQFSGLDQPDASAETESDDSLISLDGDSESSSEHPVWTSAAKTKEWLETQEKDRNWLSRAWQTQRANIYLGISALLLVIALFGLGSTDAPSLSNTAKVAPPLRSNPDAPPAPRELSFSEKMLVQFGLADPPTPPTDLGNPEAKVWIDVHTALYYCPGSDLYGKSAGGRYTTQRDAQQDAFQPALRKVCN